jgi:hypothetical protein
MVMHVYFALSRWNYETVKQKVFYVRDEPRQNESAQKAKSFERAQSNSQPGFRASRFSFLKSMKRRPSIPTQVAPF